MGGRAETLPHVVRACHLSLICEVVEGVDELEALFDSSEKRTHWASLVVTILIKFLLLLVVRHLLLVANIVTTSKALVTTSMALVTSSFLLLFAFSTSHCLDSPIFEGVGPEAGSECRVR